LGTTLSETFKKGLTVSVVISSFTQKVSSLILICDIIFTNQY